MKAQFILIELSLAITFCEIALSTSNQDTADRNAQYAQHALEGARRGLKASWLSPSAEQAIEEKLDHLRELLKKLDEPQTAEKLAG